jgi:cytochrome c biogenesis protein CcmG/thiol:disulfide interchange protein DsbE
MNDQATSTGQESAGNPRNSETPEKKNISWGIILAWTGIIAVLALVFVILLRRQEGPVSVGKKAPDFSLTAFDGQEYNLADLKGKVVVLNFWASWCKPCEQEAADLEKAWRLYEPTGEVIFLGVDWTDTEKKAFQYLEKFDITYPNGPDLGTRISQAFRTTGVPETYIIDKDGVLAYVKLSPFVSLQEITSAIDPLLGE